MIACNTILIARLFLERTVRNFEEQSQQLAADAGIVARPGPVHRGASRPTSDSGYPLDKGDKLSPVKSGILGVYTAEGCRKGAGC
jgi:hypothetical protein